jgi:hypothetical protein
MMGGRFEIWKAQKRTNQVRIGRQCEIIYLLREIVFCCREMRRIEDSFCLKYSVVWIEIEKRRLVM